MKTAGGSVSTKLDSYSTSFPATENPISEGGAWRNGKTHGGDRQDMQTGSGNAYATVTNPTDYDDSCACLTGFPPDHYIEGVVHRASGYSPTDPHEIELLLRCTINTNSIFTYEILMSTAGAFQIMRWDGTIGSFIEITFNGSGTGFGAAYADGDVVRGEISGSGTVTIVVKKNGSTVWTTTDSSAGRILTGSPGIASFMRGTGNVVSSAGWQSITAGAL
jgi:hypothetical protein